MKPGKPLSLEAGAGAEAAEAAESRNPGNRTEAGGSGGGGCRSPWKVRAGQVWRRLRRPTLLETGGAAEAVEVGRRSPLQEGDSRQNRRRKERGIRREAEALRKVTRDFPFLLPYNHAFQQFNIVLFIVNIFYYNTFLVRFFH